MNIGKSGEDLVEKWLRDRGVKILDRRWRWRRGEIDLIAIEGDSLLFIEVKTRSRGNWDANGLLAITAQKQRKLAQTAELFLLQHPDLADLACRFDVAIVHYQRSTQAPTLNFIYSLDDLESGDRLLLIDYLPGAFEFT